ncbi:MAG: hypothetical protein U0V72_06810 [Cytophagales bacterium]
MVYFQTNFSTDGKAKKYFNWLNRQTAEAGDSADIAKNVANTSLAEMYQTIYELRRRGLKENDVKQFGANYSTLANSRQSDILLESGKHIELKNKEYTSGTTPSDQEIDQVIGQKGAFGNITTLADFEWVAFASRGNTDADLRTMWKTVFTNKKTEIFEAMKPELRESLFGDISESKQVKEFEKLITNLDSNLYRFIKGE